MPLYSIYLIYTSVLAVMLVVLVPRTDIRRLAIYGIIFGGIADIIAIFLVTHLLGAGGYKNYGPFGFMGLPFFPPLAWSIWFIMYFYFLPSQRFLRYVFVCTAAAYSVVFSNVLENLGIFQWNYGKVLVPFIIYISWFSLVTWAKTRIEEGN